MDKNFQRSRFEYIFVFVVTSALINSSWAGPIKSETQQEDGLFDEAHVFLTVSSLSGVGDNDDFENRLLEINWNNIDPQATSWIGVFDYNPEDSASNDHFENALSKVTSLVEGTGSFSTEVRYAEIDFQYAVNITADGCNGFWITYFSDGNVPTISNCLRLYPTWMNDLKATIGDTPLTSLMIPGSHNAGAWKVYAGKPDDTNLIIKYLYNQEDPIYAQLMHGIRFFDIRVGHYPDAEEVYYINHDVTRIRPLISFFNDVKRFVSETNEVVLIDMHRFPVGFADDAAHEGFIEFITNELGSLLYLESGSNSTLNQVRDAGKSVILSYGEGAYSNQHDFLWPAVYHAWGDVNKVEELETYLSESMVELGCRGNFWSAMAELTPTPADIILKPNVGLRGFAEIINLPVTSWFQRKDWYSKANVISTDYYLGNNIIEIAVKVNENKAACA